MTTNTNRMLSDLPSGDPALLNRISWARRWTEPSASTDYALAARKKALDGHGRRSRAEQGFALRTLGWHAFWRGDLALAMDYCLQAETYLPEREFVAQRAGIYSVLGRIHYTRNRFDLATYSVERGVWLVQETQDTPGVLADLMLTQASIQRLTGERARAGITLGRTRELAEDETRSLVDVATANLLLDDGDAAKALDHAEAALGAMIDGSNAVCLPYARSTLAGCYLMLSKTLDAHDQITQGLAALKDGEDMMARCSLLRRRAALLIAKGETRAATEVLIEAGEIARAQTYKLHAKAIALAVAEAYEAQGDFRAAVDHHKIAWRLQNETRLR